MNQIENICKTTKVMVKEFKNYNLYSYAWLWEHWRNPFIAYDRSLFSDLIYNYMLQIDCDVKIISKQMLKQSTRKVK